MKKKILSVLLAGAIVLSTVIPSAVAESDAPAESDFVCIMPDFVASDDFSIVLFHIRYYNPEIGCGKAFIDRAWLNGEFECCLDKYNWIRERTLEVIDREGLCNSMRELVLGWPDFRAIHEARQRS
jgi:hypothetical protein